MQLEDFQEYFNLFVTNYLPFKDKEIYQTISNYLLEYYFTHSYNDIPEAFKQAYEEQIIPIEFYDYLLLSNGFPDYVVSKLSLNEKYILLQSFMDFNRYKGTLESIRKVSASFEDTFNVYELYLDYREIETLVGTDIVKEYKWVFVPDLVYKNPEIEDSLTGTVFQYYQIADKAKYYLVSEENAEQLRLTENILLPIKTNLLMLDYKGVFKHNVLLTLYTTIILNYFKDFTIILYLKDGQYKTSFKNFYKAWYYIFFKVFNVTFSELDGSYVSYDFNNIIFPFDLSELPKIKKQYEQINSKRQLTEFQEKYIDVFKTYVTVDGQNSESLIANYQIDLPSSLMDYINTRLTNISEGDNLLSELYNSLITWMYSLQSIYDEYREFMNIFAKQLPLLKISLEDTTSFLLINHFKPYHVEIIINEGSLSLYVKDKFDSVWMDHLYILYTLLSFKSLEHASHQIINNIQHINNNSVNIATMKTLIVNLITNFEVLIIHLTKQDVTYFLNTISNISHKNINNVLLYDYTVLLNVIERVLNVISKYINLLGIDYSQNFYLTNVNNSIANISHINKNSLIDEMRNINLPINSIINLLEIRISNSSSNLQSTIFEKMLIDLIKNSIENISHLTEYQCVYQNNNYPTISHEYKCY